MSEFWRSQQLRARKPYVCSECKTAIAVGQLHVYSAGKTEGVMLDFRLCLDCELICVEGCQAFWDEGAPIGAMRSELRTEHGIDDPVAWARAQQAERKPREAAEAKRLREAAHSQGVAAELVAERARHRQDEGWTVEHDDEHANGELADAASCYAAGEQVSALRNGTSFTRIWPWDQRLWKPGARRRRLIKAGALIIAEIERLDREAERASAAREGGAS